VLLVPNPQVDVIDNPDGADHARVIASHAIEDNRVTPSWIAVDRAADTNLSYRVLVRELFHEIRR
jgi:hypothetical protein